MAPGDRFGDYVVIRRLGKGGMGEVWLLRSPSGVEVAAKILNAAYSADHAARRRFLREAELARGMNHPNLVATYDVGEDPETGLCYILMEYMPGGTLADRLKAKGAMDVVDAVSVLRAIASVLELGRMNGIVHRDIKPANIMFAANGTPKLADLGIARGTPSDVEVTTVTQTGAMIGTPAYMAPEQMLDSHHVDTRADIYSLGVVFFEMLTGERPNKDDTVIQLMAKAVKGEPLPDVRTLRPEVSASLAQLLNLMVVPDRNGRIQTPGQVASAIDAIRRTGKFDTPRLRSNPPSRTAEVAGSFPWGYIVLAVGLAALAVATAVFVRKARVSPVAVEQPVRPLVQAKAESKVRPAAPVANAGRKDMARPLRKAVNAEPKPFEIRSTYRGGRPAQGWLAIRSNGMFDVKMTAESVLSGDGDVERVICMRYPQPCAYQGIRWYGDEPKMFAFVPETSDWYLRIAEKGCHLKDVDVAFEFNVECKSARVDFSKVDGRVPYDKAASQYKAFTRDWRTENPGRVRVSLAHPWIVARRGELLSAAGDDHLAYASRAYGLVAGEFSVSGEDADISKTIDRKRGSDCAVASVFVSLLRSAGIPARTLCGKRADGSTVFVPEFYLEGCGWIPADIAKDAGRNVVRHFGVYDEVCVILSSDLDVSVQGARGEVCRLERLYPAWWWFYNGRWTPCETFFGWWGRAATEESFKSRKEAASADARKSPRPQSKATQTVVFPILDRAPDAWAYSFDEERGWRDPRFDDSKWKRAQGGFGNRNGGIHIRTARINTAWKTNRLFLRRRFNWSGGDVSRVVVDAYHDDDMSIYLNGRLMLTVNGYNTNWQPFEIPARRFARALREGENVFCVEARQDFGEAQYFDCGLVVECGGEIAAHAGQDGVRRVKTAHGTWTIVVNDGVAQLGNGRDVALDPRPKGALKIPAKLDGLAIRKLARDCFTRCGELESVEIPEGVRSVGQGAFFECGRLEKVVLPETLEHLGVDLLCGSKLKSIDLKNVRLIDSGAFRFCNGLNAVSVGGGNPKYRVKDGVLYDRVRRAVVFFPRSRSTYSFPSGIEEIGDCAFQRSMLKNVSIPRTVKFVGGCAFNECPRLESVKFRGDDVDIGEWAFGNTPALRTVVLPSRQKALDGFSIFRNAGQLEEIVLPDTLETIDDNVFSDCPRLRKVEFGKSLDTIGHHAFAACPCLKSVRLPGTMRKMGAEVFLDCRRLESVTFSGDAPEFFAMDECRGADIYRGTSPSLVTFVPKGSKGWQDGADGLPRKWPAEGGESARQIRYGK